jgi:AcrR family transcriptional regulator
MRVTAETKLATRQRILGAAQRLFASEGFEAATTRDLAREAEIGVGTLFNYFPTKEAVALCLVSEALADVACQSDEPLTLEEELFAHAAAVLRKLKPFRKYVAAVVETALTPLSSEAGAAGLRAAHLETVSQIVVRHGQSEALSTVAMQLYWTLYVGVLGHWSQDRSPRQEDTLALLDQSLAMFVGWLTTQSNPAANLKFGA